MEGVSTAVVGIPNPKHSAGTGSILNSAGRVNRKNTGTIEGPLL